MRKFRTKPKVVTAEQWRVPGHPDHVPIAGVEAGYPLRMIDGEWKGDTRLNPTYYFETTRVWEGDWIVTDEFGNRILVHDMDFQKIYEEIKE